MNILDSIKKAYINANKFIDRKIYEAEIKAKKQSEAKQDNKR